MSLARPEILQTLPGPEDITRVELPNGIVVLVRSNFESASVTLSGYLPAGGLFDPPEKLGLAHFTALGLTRGTERHHFQQIFNLLESAGASLGFGASVYNINFGGRALAEDLPLLLSLLAECLRIPRFPQKPIERLRRQILTGIAIRDQDPADRAEMMFDEVLFPNHPFGKPTDGTRHTIARITREDLLAFHRHYFGPRGMTLVIVGAVSAEQVLEEVQRTLGDWKNPLQPAFPEIPAVAPLAQSVRSHIALPGKVQTELVMGTLGPSRLSPDFMPASLGNNILGQFGLMGRIGNVVREQEGLAYEASTSLNAWKDAGTWEVTAGVNPANLQRAIDLILAEIRRFIAEPVSWEELRDSQSHYLGRLPLSLESNAGVAHAILNLERFQLGLDYYKRYPALVESVTPEQILEVARRWLDPERFAIISAGPPME